MEGRKQEKRLEGLEMISAHELYPVSFSARSTNFEKPSKIFLAFLEKSQVSIFFTKIKFLAGKPKGVNVSRQWSFNERY